MPTFTNDCRADEKPAKVPRCRKPGHRKHVPGCEDCRKWSAYNWRLRKWEKAHGIHGLVPTGTVKEHLKFLIEKGNLVIEDIACKSGISRQTVTSILTDDRITGILSITEISLLAIRPSDKVRPPQISMVPALEGVRILRGLRAQGWTATALGLHVGSRAHVQRITARQGEWMYLKTLHLIRRVAANLGRYDIHNLPEPMPGMTWNAVADSERQGWAALSRWHGRDIADPDATPAPASSAVALPDPGTGTQAEEFGLIDEALHRQILKAAQRAKEFNNDPTRPTTSYINPLGRITRLEMHAAWWFAESAGLNDTQIGRLLNYPITDERELDTAQRQVNRIREKVVAARRWIEESPPGWVPSWFTWSRSNNCRTNFGNMLPALIAVQPAPFGYGWTAAQLAEHCGVEEHDMVVFLTASASVGNRMWQPQVQTRDKATRRAPQNATCTPTGRVRAA